MPMFPKSLFQPTHSRKKNEIIESINNNEDIQFFWCRAATEMTQKLAMMLFCNIIVLFMTMRGFSLINTCMELYKEASEKYLQQSKGLLNREAYIMLAQF